MKNISLKIINELEDNVLQYLPYGVTTLEMRVEGDKDEAYGFIYPDKRTAGKNKFYVGYTDGNEDFLVLWGAGKEKGLDINNQNINGRLFLQLLHKGKEPIKSQNISILHDKLIMPINTIKLVPAEDNANLVRMELDKKGDDSHTISFKGNKMPIYYSRWFPPKPSVNEQIIYYDVDRPPITIKFKSKRDDFVTNIDSDIDIFLDNNKIGQVTGDWRYSWPHAELFTVFGDNDYFVLRFWLYWIHKNFSTNIFLGGDAFAAKIEEAQKVDSIPEDEETRRGWWESFDIETPDNERFDFLIDMKKKKIIWVGTDFHYQESWYKIEDNETLVKTRIANDVNTIEQVFKRLKDRFNQPKENYDPMIRLKEILRKRDTQRSLTLEDIPAVREYTVSNLDDKRNVTYRAVGFTRKHVPYAENGKAVAELVSSVVTS